MAVALVCLATALYAASAAFGIAYVRSGSDKSFRLARGLAALGFAVHTAILVWWGVQHGRLPAYATFEALATLLWCAVLAYLTVARAPQARALPAFLMPLVVAGCVATLVLASPDAPPGSTARSWWLPIHVVSSLLGAADFLLAFAVAVMYLVQRRLLKRKTIGPLMARLPALETLDRLNYLAVALGLPVFTFALVSGVVLAAETGPGWWANWMVAASLLAWLVFALLLHVRMGAGMRGPKVAYLTILGSLLVVAIVCGIAFASDSLHRLRPEGGSSPVEAPRDAS